MPSSSENEESRVEGVHAGDSHEDKPLRRKAARGGSYDSWTVPELRSRAKELGMTGYSSLSKSDLIYELRKM